MAKTSTDKASEDLQNLQASPDKQYKKLAKREAKLRLRIKTSQKDVQKAERKLSQAKTTVETLMAQLQAISGQMTQQQTRTERSHKGELASTLLLSPVALEPEETENNQKPSKNADKPEPDSGDSYEESEAIEELHHASLPPVEGRNDVPNQEQNKGVPIEFHDEIAAKTTPSNVAAETNNGDSYEESEAIEELHHTSLPPVEGRGDV